MTRDRVKSLRDWARLAQSLGWKITETGSGHMRWCAPDGTLVFTSSTPGDYRSLMNDRARLRRAGLRGI